MSLPVRTSADRVLAPGNTAGDAERSTATVAPAAVSRTGSLGPVRPAEDQPGGITGRDAVLAAATRRYLAGRRLDMSEIAVELGIGRATLYRWAGKHDDVLAEVLADQTERLFRHTVVDDGRSGADRVLAVLDGFMRSVLGSAPLQALTARDPVLFLRLATMPGAIEARSTALIAEVIEQEQRAGRLRVALPATVLGQSIVRIADSFLYRHLLGAGEPDISSALDLVALLLRPDRGSRTDLPDRSPGPTDH
jgi:AcrR family transcriptional regulator